MNSADSNDLIAITFSGHGYGVNNGLGDSLLWTQDIQEYTDQKFALALNENSDAGQLFIFLHACFAGGMGPEIMASGPGAIGSV